MARDVSFNLFYQSSNSKKKKSEGDKKKAAAKPTVAAKPPSPSLTLRAPSKLPAEFQEMFDRMYSMHKEIEDKIKKIHELTGYSAHDLQVYGNNPSNFSAEQWKALQEKKEQIEGKLLAFLGTTITANRQSYINREVNEKQTREQIKNRKSKTVAARKKNWISMR